MITHHLNIRSFAKLTMTCKMYYEMYSKVVKQRKRKFLQESRYTYVTNYDETITFAPGPAIPKLPSKMPVDGVYFSEDNGRSISFFYHHFSEFLNKESEEVGYKYVATINTETSKIHNHDLGTVYIRASDRKFMGLYHYDDIDADYRELFAIGKEKIAEFWKHY